MVLIVVIPREVSIRIIELGGHSGFTESFRQGRVPEACYYYGVAGHFTHEFPQHRIIELSVYTTQLIILVPPPTRGGAQYCRGSPRVPEVVHNKVR